MTAATCLHLKVEPPGAMRCLQHLSVSPPLVKLDPGTNRLRAHIKDDTIQLGMFAIYVDVP